MLEALLLAVAIPGAATFAEARSPTRPSLELLEFLGEFGDDEEGLFDAAGRAPEEGRSPVENRDARAPAKKSPTPPPAPPRDAAKEASP